MLKFISKIYLVEFYAIERFEMADETGGIHWFVSRTRTLDYLESTVRISKIRMKSVSIN